MKRVLTAAIVFVLIALLSSTAVFAASNTYDLDELGLQVTIPSGYSVITRDTPASDPIFSDSGITKSALISQFETSSIYLNALSNTYNEEIVVTMIENSMSNLSLLSDMVLNTFASELINQFTDYGINVSKYEIYQHSQAKFIRLTFTDTDNTVHGLQYYTIHDGKAMNFTMRSYEGSLSSRQETAIKTVVDSIKYDNAPLIADPVEETNSFIYTDTDSGVTFTVPENWKQKEFFEDREYIDVKFASTKEDGITIIYGSTDMWEQLSASDKVGFTRSDINNSAFTKSDIAEMYNTTADKISVVSYNGVQYYKVEIDYSSDTYGTDISVTMTQLVYYDNGWMYMFQFNAPSTHKMYSEFENLLNSVQYPTVSNVPGISSFDNTPSTTDNSDDNSGVIALIVLLLIVVVVVIIIAVVLSRKKNAQKNIQSSYTPNSNTIIPQPPYNPEPTVLCKNCGKELPVDSVFCHVCGNQINKEEN